MHITIKIDIEHHTTYAHKKIDYRILSQASKVNYMIDTYEIITSKVCFRT